MLLSVSFYPLWNHTLYWKHKSLL